MATPGAGETEVPDWSQLPTVMHQGLFGHTGGTQGHEPHTVCLSAASPRGVADPSTDTLETKVLEGAGKPSPFRFPLPLLSHTLSLYAGRFCQYFSALSYSLGLQSA